MAWEMVREALISLPADLPPPLPGQSAHHTLIRGDGEPIAQLTIRRPYGEPFLEFLVEHHNPHPDLFNIEIAEFYPYIDPTTPFRNPFTDWLRGQTPNRVNQYNDTGRKDSTQSSHNIFDGLYSPPADLITDPPIAAGGVSRMAATAGMAGTAAKKLSPIVEFYDPDIQGGDARNRKLRLILGWSDDLLEKSHDYIQWLFPLPEGSVFNYNAPVVTEEVADTFRNCDELRRSMSFAFERMMNFYGYEVSCFDVTRGPNWDQRSQQWCRRSDHNHLRITRILRSLRVLGMQQHCDAFWKVLQETYDDPNINIGPTSMKFWQRAINQPLHIAPDGEKVDWLKKYEPKAEEATKEDTEKEAKKSKV